MIVNSVYHKRQKYIFLIISFLIHALLFLIIFFLAKKVLTEKSGNSDLRAHKTANISFSNLGTQLKTQAAQKIQNMQAAQAIQKLAPATNIQNKINNKINTKTDPKILKALESINKAITKPTNIIKKQIKPKEKIKSEIIQENKVIEKKIINNIIEQKTETEKIEIENTENTQKKITGAQLVQAFKQVYREEQEERYRNYSNSSNSNSNQIYNQSYNSSEQEVVNGRASQWKYASYNTRVNEALVKAFNTKNYPIYFEESVYTQIIILIILNKDGKILDAYLEKPSGYKPLDRHILDIIKTAQFAPIPEHLGISQYKFTHSPFVRIEKGNHVVVYSYS